MTRPLLLVLFLLAGCAPAALPAPTSRAEACARLRGPTVELGQREFCTVSGPSLCGARNASGQRFECATLAPGTQSVCVTPRVPGVEYGYPVGPCYPENGGADCPAWWQCVPYYGMPRDGILNWCVPGPPCGAEGDAGASDAGSNDR